MQQTVQYQPRHQHEVLVAGLTLFQEIHHLHGPVPDIVTVVDVFEPIRSNFTTVQAD